LVVDDGEEHQGQVGSCRDEFEGDVHGGHLQGAVKEGARSLPHPFEGLVD
jgi:hypothetical protein